jgi:hypothetical protein
MTKMSICQGAGVGEKRHEPNVTTPPAAWRAHLVVEILPADVAVGRVALLLQRLVELAVEDQHGLAGAGLQRGVSGATSGPGHSTRLALHEDVDHEHPIEHRETCAAHGSPAPACDSQQASPLSRGAHGGGVERSAVAPKTTLHTMGCGRMKGPAGNTSVPSTQTVMDTNHTAGGGGARRT